MNDRLADLSVRCRPVHGLLATAPAALVLMGERIGLAQASGPYVRWNVTMPEVEDVGAITLTAAALIAEGHVRITAELQEAAETSPWGGVLDFRPGDPVDGPLRAAVIQSVVAALWNAADVQPAAA